MQRPRHIEDDEEDELDLELDLPDSDTSLGEDEPEGLGGDEAIDEAEGLITEGQAEDVGLDAEAGLDEPEEHELDTVDADEDRSWSDGDEAADDLAVGDDEVGDEAEYGWTDDNEPADDGGFDEGVVTLDEGGSFVDDGGVEGLEDDGLEAEVDPGALPPLERATNEPDEEMLEQEEELDARELELLAASMPDEDLVELAEGVHGAVLPPEAVLLTTLLQQGAPLGALAATARHGLAWDGTLRVSAAGDAAERRFSRADALWDLAAVERGAALIVALATPEGLLISRDGGRSFAPAAALPGGGLPPNRVAFSRDDAGEPKLWAAAPEGPLCVSHDLGASFRVSLDGARVLGLQSDGRRGLVAVARDEGGAGIAEHSVDGGRSFRTVELPASEVERLQQVRVCGETLLVSRRSPEPQLLLAHADEPWSEVLAQAAPPALLLDEDGRTIAYFCLQTPTGVSLLRRALDTVATPERVCELPGDSGQALQLEGSHREGMTTLHLGSERAWYRITVRAGGRAR
ncbi:MAG: hypothetical protein PVI30_22520 [Myxococcales bacterium]|jgi:hypothetical protein